MMSSMFIGQGRKVLDRMFTTYKKPNTEADECDIPVIRYKPEGLLELSHSTNFTKAELQLLYRGFKQECPTGIVDQDTFKDIYQQYFPQGDSSQYATYVFNTFDVNKNGRVTFEEFVSGLSVLSRGTIDEKLQWAFTLYDINHDGHITREEMVDIVGAIYNMLGGVGRANYHLIPHTSDIHEHVDRVFTKMDVNKDGVITIDEFMNACFQDHDVIKSVAFFDTVFY